MHPLMVVHCCRKTCAYKRKLLAISSEAEPSVMSPTLLSPAYGSHEWTPRAWSSPPSQSSRTFSMRRCPPVKNHFSGNSPMPTRWTARRWNIARRKNGLPLEVFDSEKMLTSMPRCTSRLNFRSPKVGVDVVKLMSILPETVLRMLAKLMLPGDFPGTCEDVPVGGSQKDEGELFVQRSLQPASTHPSKVALSRPLTATCLSSLRRILRFTGNSGMVVLASSSMASNSSNFLLPSGTSLAPMRLDMKNVESLKARWMCGKSGAGCGVRK